MERIEEIVRRIGAPSSAGKIPSIQNEREIDILVAVDKIRAAPCHTALSGPIATRVNSFPRTDTPHSVLVGELRQARGGGEQATS
jgi:hypothetical protein